MTAGNPTPEDLRNLTPETIRYLLEQDFRTLWDAVAADPDIHARGNFTFGREAVALLEVASRVCATDPSGQALTDFSTELERIEPRYFTLLPAPAAMPQQFTLPSAPGNGPVASQLISAIFDLIRNGQAHQRQQIMVATSDDKTFGISLTGAGYGLDLDRRLSSGRPPQHLSLLVDEDDSVYVVVCPEVLFLDLHEAITRSGIFHRGLLFDYLARPGKRANQYAYSANDIHQALAAGGHPAFTPPARQAPPSAGQPDQGSTAPVATPEISDEALSRGRRWPLLLTGSVAGALITGVAGSITRRRR